MPVFSVTNFSPQTLALSMLLLNCSKEAIEGASEDTLRPIGQVYSARGMPALAKPTFVNNRVDVGASISLTLWRRNKTWLLVGFDILGFAQC